MMVRKVKMNSIICFNNNLHDGKKNKFYGVGYE